MLYYLWYYSFVVSIFEMLYYLWWAYLRTVQYFSRSRDLCGGSRLRSALILQIDTYHSWALFFEQMLSNISNCKGHSTEGLWTGKNKIHTFSNGRRSQLYIVSHGKILCLMTIEGYTVSVSKALYDCYLSEYTKLVLKFHILDTVSILCFKANK